ncbi:MAG: nitrogenase component 1 [Chloroflexi bacterium]|nr:nitrogenase component 1 [Chloroflexota bacterium]
MATTEKAPVGHEELPWHMPNDTCWLFFVMRAAAPMRKTAVIIHAARGCAWAIQEFLTLFHSQGPPYPTAYRIYSTAMDKQNIIYGGAEKLEQTIYDVYNNVRDYPLHPEDSGPPEIIWVFTGCSADLIGEDIKAVARKAEKKIDAKVLAVHSAGYAYRDPIPVNHRDEFIAVYDALIDEVMKPAKTKRPNSVNILGEHTPNRLQIEELIWPLERLGIEVNCVLTAGATREEVERAPEAMLNAVRCDCTTIHAAERMQEKFGVPYYTPGMAPIGIKVTEEWVMNIAAFFGKEKEAKKLVEEETAKAEAAIAEQRELLKGKRVAVGAGFTQPIAIYRYLAELGTNPVIISMAAGVGRYLPIVEKVAKENGLEPPAILMRDRQDELSIQLAYEKLKPELEIGSRPVPKRRPDLAAYRGLPPDIVQRVVLEMGGDSCVMDLMRYEEPWFGFHGAVKFVRDISRTLKMPEKVTLPPELDELRAKIYPKGHPIWLHHKPLSEEELAAVRQASERAG